MSRLGFKNAIKDKATGSFVPGFGKFRSAAVAYDKCIRLEAVLQAYFHDISSYDGTNINENDSLKAIKYVISKKINKAARRGMQGGLIFGAAVAGAATGATAGSIVPVLGTVGGGIAGLVALETAASGAVGVVDLAARGFKAAYKSLKGTRGEHREQAARALDHCARTREGTTYGMAAEEALEIILGEEYQRVMAKSSDDAIERIAQRIKSV